MVAGTALGVCTAIGDIPIIGDTHPIGAGVALVTGVVTITLRGIGTNLIIHHTEVMGTPI